VHASTEDKSNGKKKSFYEELERVFNKFLNTTWKFSQEIKYKSRGRYLQNNNRK
jgi:hypothetical protein